MYLLDTNVCIRFINGRSPILRENFRQHKRSQMRVSIISRAELYCGSAKSQTPAVSGQKQMVFLKGIKTILFDESAAVVYGDIRTDLERRGLTIGELDRMIAAVALANRFTLVTHNTREFSRVFGLTIEDWEITKP